MDVGELRLNWDAFGRTIPLRAILWKQGPWDEGEFFATGTTEVNAALALLERFELQVGGRALDFGCGVGRLTQALADRFDEAVGVDVARSMIELAEHYNRFPDRCRYVLNEAPDLRCFGDATFDFVLSYIALQHVGSELAKRYIAEFVRVLRPGGVALFQVPSVFVPPAPLPEDAFRAELRLAAPPPAGPAAALQAVAGDSISIQLTVRNTSRVRWEPAHRLLVAGRWASPGVSAVEDDQRPQVLIGQAVDPSAEVGVEVVAAVPSRPAPYVLELDVVHESQGPFRYRGSRALEVPVEAVPPAGDAGTAVAGDGGGQGSYAPRMAMQPVPRDEVVAILRAAGAEVVAVLDDELGGRGWVSFKYLARKAHRP